jgi:hypothetical protein
MARYWPPARPAARVRSKIHWSGEPTVAANRAEDRAVPDHVEVHDRSSGRGEREVTRRSPRDSSAASACGVARITASASIRPPSAGRPLRSRLELDGRTRARVATWAPSSVSVRKPRLGVDAPAGAGPSRCRRRRHPASRPVWKTNAERERGVFGGALRRRTDPNQNLRRARWPARSSQAPRLHWSSARSASRGFAAGARRPRPGPLGQEGA